MLFGRGKKATLAVTGMSCGHCEQSVEKGLADVAGVTKVKADHEANLVTLHYKDEEPSLGEVRTKVAELGYEAGDDWT